LAGFVSGVNIINGRLDKIERRIGLSHGKTPRLLEKFAPILDNAEKMSRVIIIHGISSS
jgi:hypothetical protein